MNKTTRIIIGVIIVALAVWAIGVLVHKDKKQTAKNLNALSSEPVKIGFIGPLTGDQANFGENAQAAVEIAVDEINNAGGINGRKLKVLYEDGKCTGKDANNAANKLIDIDRVPVILGGMCSGETMAFTQKAEAAKTVVLSYCSSSPAITNAGDYIFRDYPSDSFQGSFVAEYVYNNLNKKKVVVLFTNNNWGIGIKDVFVPTFEQLGGQITDEEGFDPGTRDFKTLFSKIKATNPDLLYFIGYTESAVPGLKQKAQLQYDVPVFGADGFDDPKIWQEVGSAGQGIMYSVAAAQNDAAFKIKMKAKTGSDSYIMCTPAAYDATKIIAQVMQKAGTVPENIKNELYKVNYTGGVFSDKIAFDQNGDPVNANFAIKIVKNGKAEELR
jgi:branched-chain amino acid transport system substrate-binding protein